MSKNGLISLSKPFNDRLNTKRLMNTNSAAGPTTRKNRQQMITTFHEVIE